MTVLNTMSYSRCVICRSGGLEHWASAFFFLWTFCFFSARPRRFGEKKVTRNIEKKAHGLIHFPCDNYLTFFFIWSCIPFISYAFWGTRSKCTEDFLSIYLVFRVSICSWCWWILQRPRNGVVDPLVPGLARRRFLFLGGGGGEGVLLVTFWCTFHLQFLWWK